jgi:DNA-binding transcriptional MerR regulator
METLLQTRDVALRLGLSVEMVRQLERSGTLPAEKTLRGHRLFRVVDVERVAAERDQRRQAKATAAKG